MPSGTVQAFLATQVEQYAFIPIVLPITTGEWLLSACDFNRNNTL
jgi:hypothetical protein